jgi:hypothetical protein
MSSYAEIELEIVRWGEALTGWYGYEQKPVRSGVYMVRQSNYIWTYHGWAYYNARGGWKTKGWHWIAYTKEDAIKEGRKGAFQEWMWRGIAK